jgi:hypothetical protein
MTDENEADTNVSSVTSLERFNIRAAKWVAWRPPVSDLSRRIARKRRPALEPHPTSRYNQPVKAILLRLALGLGALATLGACSKEIGDDCMTSIDCSSAGDRTCDIAQPGGYCTIVGCDNTSCPSEAVCIRFFPEQFLTKQCCAGDANCLMPPLAPPPPCNADEICLAVDMAPGLCAPRTEEQRQCERSCGSDGDCRSGYKCVTTNLAAGTLPYASDPAVGTPAAKFCSPAVASPTN